jgi:hypothetical protein
MTAPTQAAPSDQKAAGKAGNGKTMIIRKFRAGVQDHQEVVQTVNIVPGAAPTTNQIEVPAYGFLRGLWIKVTITGGAGGGAVYRGNAPFTWIQSVQLQDVNSSPIIFPITGFDLYLIYKYGGYYFQADAQNAEEYTQGGANGNSVFVLYLPLEVRCRDGFGSLPNSSANTAYKLTLTGGVLTDVYSTNPVTPPTNMRVDVYQDSWWEPKEFDLAGRPQAQDPPSKDSTQYWSKVVFSHSSSGAITDQIKRLGYMYRNLIASCYDTASPAVRNTTNFPDPLTVVYEGQQLTIRDKTVWRHQMARWFGYTATVDTAGGLTSGVFVLPFNRDFGLQPGAEVGNAYLPTASGTRVELQGNLGAAGSIQVLVNDVSAEDELDVTG